MTTQITLDTRIEDAVGGRTAKAIEKAFGYRTVLELLRHYPRRMAERGELTNLAELRIDEEVTVLAEVRKVAEFGYGKTGRVVITVGDGKGELDLVFFGPKVRWRVAHTKVGSLGLFSGKVGVFNRRRQLVHPEFHLLSDEAMAMQEADYYSRTLIPVYPATKDIRTWHIQNAVKQV